MTLKKKCGNGLNALTTNNRNGLELKGDVKDGCRRSDSVLRHTSAPFNPVLLRTSDITTYQGWQFDMPEEDNMHEQQRQKFVKKHKRNSSLPDAFFSSFLGKKSSTQATGTQQPATTSDSASTTIPTITTTTVAAATVGDKSSRSTSSNKSSRRNTSPLLARHADSSASTATGKMKVMQATDGALSSAFAASSELGASNNTLEDDETETGNGGGSVTSDDHVDGEDSARLRATREHLQAKIERTMGHMKEEQAKKEDNVNEYLRLARNADKQQLSRIKSVFEKRNKALTQSVASLQRKLDLYEQRLQQLGKHGASAPHRPRHVLKDMGQGLKGVVDSVRGAKDSIVSKPKEFAHLIKNKFGSADNINTMKQLDDSELTTEDYPTDTDKQSHYSGQVQHGFRLGGGQSEDGEEGASLVSSGSNHSNAQSGVHSGVQSSPHPQSDSLPNHRHTGLGSGSEGAGLETSRYNELQQLVRQLSQQQMKLEDAMVTLKAQIEEETSYFKQVVEEERYRAKCLEEQINDLGELHQHEVTNIKQELQSMEEKMEYQLEERTRDMQELLESCQTRITKMELQQQQQQLISMEAFENSNFRNLITKLINVVLAVLAVILVLVSTLANILGPFIYSRFRIVSTVVLIAAIVVTWRNWTQVQDLYGNLADNYGHLVPWHR